MADYPPPDPTMAEISERELFQQLREIVERLSADGPDQVSWLQAQHLPVDELMLQLDDAVPAWFPRLERAGLIEASAKSALQSLLDFLISLRWDKALWQDEAVESRPEWQQARLLAHGTLSKLDDPHRRTTL
jgi:hypothetical protein